MVVLCLRDLGLWLSLIPDETQKNSDSSSCPSSPVCTEGLPPTQVNGYSEPKLSFAPNFRNSISMYSLPNRNSRKLTLADGPHDFAQRGHGKEAPPPQFISKPRHRAERQATTSQQGSSRRVLAGPSFYVVFLFFLAAAHKAPTTGEPP